MRLRAMVLVGLLVTGGLRRAGAGEGSKSDSKGSNDSSKSSGDSSKSSGDSSDRSGQGSRDSPKESSQGSSDETSKSKGGQALSVAAVLLVVGGIAVSAVVATAATRRPAQTQALARFLRQNHALVTRDVLMGEGPLLAAWARDLGLSAAEREKLGRAMGGSPEQAELLRALDGKIDEARAQRFAVGFARLGRRALGADRLQAIALAVLR